MKIYNLLKFILPLFLFFGIHIAGKAQVISGKIIDLQTQLNIAAGAADLRLQGSDSIRLTTGPGQEIFLTLHHHKKIQNEDHYYGRITGNETSSFRIMISGDSIQGVILDRLHKRAYKISSDGSGNVSIAPTDAGNVICIDYNAASTGLPAPASIPAAGSATYTLQSNPTSKSVAYLDFDGQTVEGTLWNNGNVIVAIPGNFSEADVQNIFNLVSEDYSGFNINITTDSNVYNAATRTSRVRCILTPTNTASPGSGGVSYVGSFTWGDGTPCWVFNGGARNAGEAASHEIGHTVGLIHDGRTKPKEEYFAGQGNWAPIMGVGYYKTVVQWSMGEYQNANNLQDDINIIATQNGFTYKTDNAGNTIADAALLSTAADGTVSATANSGIIERRTDVDIFKFSCLSGTVSFSATPTAAAYADLDIQLDLLDAQGNILISANPAGLAASLTYNLAAGTYYLSVDGVGYKSPLTDGYSDYSSIGAYAVSGSIPVSSVANILPNVSISAPADGTAYNAPATITITAVASDPDGSIQKVEFFNGTTKLGESSVSPYQYTWTNVAIGNYNLTAKATDNLSAVFTSSVIQVSVIKPACTVANTEAGYNNIIGTDSSYQNDGYTRDFAFDNDSTTYFDSPDVSGSWAGLDMDGIYNITGVRYFPRASFSSRMTGGKFQGSSTPDFSSGVVDLGTITGTPASNWNCFTFSTQGTFKYVRYLSPDNSNGNVAEIQFYGTKTSDQAPLVQITAPVTNTYIFVPQSVTIQVNATDPDGTVAKVELYDGSIKLGETTSAPYQFVLNMDTVHTWQLVAKATDNLGDYGLSDSVVVYAVNPVCAIQGTILTSYTILGTTGSYNNSGFTRDKVFDDDSTTYFDAPSGNGTWVGLDFGSVVNITGVRFYPRINYQSRMINGRFQVATNATFTQGLITIDTLLTVQNNEWNCIHFPAAYQKRYFRYLGPNNSHCNISELQVYTQSAISAVNDPQASPHSFAVFPNPARDQINIISGEAIERISLASLQGVLLKEYSDPQALLPLPDGLSSGFYYLIAYYKDGESVTAKLLIAK
jgi:hypothetical protein